MRKSLNNKRNEIAEEHIAEITRIYGNYSDGEAARIRGETEVEELVVSKVFDNSEFGFRQITIERPLRLNFQAGPDRIERLREVTAFQNLARSKKKDKGQVQIEEKAGREQQEKILETLGGMDQAKLYKNRDSFVEDLHAAFAEAGVKLSAPIRKAVLAALSERDETAEICRDEEGKPEPDTELRDYENVPLKEDIREYFKREVVPHVPDAWINESVIDKKDGKVGVVGYEIPLTRHFYRYVPPRPLAEIRSEIAALETDIVRMLREVVG
jgi:type I restriction enzyme M protein